MKKIITIVLLTAFLSPPTIAADDQPFFALSADCDNNPIAPKCEVRNFYNKTLNCTIETNIGLNNTAGNLIERLQVQTITLQPNSKVIIVGQSYPMLKFKYIITSASCFQPY
jgi:hypothetical protein